MSITAQDKLAAVEEIIEAMRWVRSQPDHPRHRTLLTIRAIAADIRGAMNGAPTVAVFELQRRIDAAERSKTGLGYDGNRMHALGAEVMARWPVVRQALERFEHALQKEPT